MRVGPSRVLIVRTHPHLAESIRCAWAGRAKGFFRKAGKYLKTAAPRSDEHY